MRTKEANPFHLAKRYLAHTIEDEHYDRKQEFICHALRDVWTANKCDGTDFAVAKRMVLARLSPYGTINCYLMDLAMAKTIRMRDITYENTQFFRHRWLDHLADEWDQGIRK